MLPEWTLGAFLLANGAFGVFAFPTLYSKVYKAQVGLATPHPLPKRPKC